MPRLLLLALLAVSSTSHAIVIRHDVPDADYRIPASAFPALVDMPHEGHGVLIAPQWVITAAHTVPGHGGLKQVVIGGTPRDVEDVVIHPGYARPPQALIDQALSTGEWILTVVQIASVDDIALIKLVDPVADVAPAALHKARAEPGQTLQLIGKGATGTGADGHDPQGPNRTELRRGFNTITSAHDRWFCYVFDEPEAALPLEAKTGSGDSGGPALVEAEGQWELAGLAAWGFIHGDVRTARPGRYGQFTCNVRLSHYADWIERVVSGAPQEQG
ncbi:trypsin-like serine protease [Pseudoxanthomonas sp. PXM01]|uniref:S1 family peptidase n=1 Tax=Pseudoxanthomonas sp. PXM01 TaxID=2769295 RepID=UPI00177C7F7B|nr:trypsin-like serine protease [Pseudoxanthomonas sp. PXM01]MBD9470889.1 trypsin-like serine protease [Pseudoxanthomonas sp. PXM01]